MKYVLENKSLDELVMQYTEEQVTFEDIAILMRKRIKCIAWKAAKAFYRFSAVFDVEDYENIALFALKKAIDTWKPEKASFSTYYEKVVHSELHAIRRGMNALHRQSNLDTISIDTNVKGEEQEWLRSFERGYALTDFWESYSRLGLSYRQDEICRMIMLGYRNKEIASILGISEGAVSMMINRMQKKFEKIY
ncbi:helix-turn-helix transcriptional regulator [Brevibacillus sp. SYSU BS000544]|uniref:helix-turn-helix transcriptional regulator n=1 Tax=Brevibacillus sp. SYSU BS000544 TaxID=3416443 RepID=UPI003CE5B1FA